MGRRKIQIDAIQDSKLRKITFHKRKIGLIRKAAELSLLCDVNLLLVFEDTNGKLIQYSRDNIKNINNFYENCHFGKIVEFTSYDYPNFFSRKEHDNESKPETSYKKNKSTNSKRKTAKTLSSTDFGSSIEDSLEQTEKSLLQSKVPEAVSNTENNNLSTFWNSSMLALSRLPSVTSNSDFSKYDLQLNDKKVEEFPEFREENSGEDFITYNSENMQDNAFGTFVEGEEPLLSNYLSCSIFQERPRTSYMDQYLGGSYNENGTQDKGLQYMDPSISKKKIKDI